MTDDLDTTGQPFGVVFRQFIAEPQPIRGGREGMGEAVFEAVMAVLNRGQNGEVGIAAGLLQPRDLARGLGA